MGDAATRAAKTLAAGALWGAILVTPSAASAPVPVNGVDAIVAAFQQRPVFALGELHGWSVDETDRDPGPASPRRLAGSKRKRFDLDR